MPAIPAAAGRARNESGAESEDAYGDNSASSSETARNDSTSDESDDSRAEDEEEEETERTEEGDGDEEEDKGGGKHDHDESSADEEDSRALSSLRGGGAVSEFAHLDELDMVCLLRDGQLQLAGDAKAENGMCIGQWFNFYGTDTQPLQDRVYAPAFRDSTEVRTYRPKRSYEAVDGEWAKSEELVARFKLVPKIPANHALAINQRLSEMNVQPRSLCRAASSKLGAI
jgi:hypothetical protein